VSFFVGKLAAQLVLPLSLVALLMVIALGCLLLRWHRSATAVLAVGTALLWLASSRALADRLVASLEQTHPGAPIEALAAADAILLLGGATQPAAPPRQFPEISEAGDRILHAARLYRAGKAPIIIASGGRMPWQEGLPPEAESMRALLIELGVPDEAIVLEVASKNTWENCGESKALLEERDARDVLLVTSAIHMPRALATCSTAGIDAQPAPTDYLVVEEGVRTWLDWTPHPAALLHTHYALRELLGYRVYRWRGWIGP
jgi:uncharacterized SAM-binding protein YcdF (DUF218 family)